MKHELELQMYYELWLKGKTHDEIKAIIPITESLFNRLEPMFLSYCQKQAAFDTREALANAESADIAKLTPDRRKKFLEYVSLGLSYGKAAQMLNVPLATVTEFWFKQDILLRVEAKSAAEMLDAQITMSLAKRALGYNVPVETVVKVESELPGGETSQTTTTSKSTRHIPGDTGAQKFWLINRSSDKFSIDGEVNKTSNKGAILEAINSMVSEEDDSSRPDMAALEEKYGDGTEGVKK